MNTQPSDKTKKVIETTAKVVALAGGAVALSAICAPAALAVAIMSPKVIKMKWF